jgi:hypothetical protein
VLLFVDGWMLPADTARAPEPLRSQLPRPGKTMASKLYVVATQTDSPSETQSIFSTALLEGLRGAATNTSGRVTGNMLQSYLRYRMEEIPGSRPSPSGPKLRFEGDSDIVIVETLPATA